MRDEDLWKSVLDTYTQDLVLYAGLVLASAVLVLTILTLFQPNTFSFISVKGMGIVVLYSLLTLFTAWIATRVMVAYEAIGEAMRSLRSDSRTLEDLDKELIQKIDPLRLKYRFHGLTGDGFKVAAFVLVILLMASLFVLYYLA